MTSGSTPIRVLFAEDAFDQALVVKTFLGTAGIYAVTHSQDGDSAAELLRSQEWDLFITDLNLPGTDGFDLIRISREVHPEVPIMATTGYTATHYQDQAFRAGADDLMIKPLDREDFLRRLEKLFAPTEDVTPSEGCILAIGGLVGDAEMGCGGSLLEWATQGKKVLIVPIFGDQGHPDDATVAGARAAASVIGARPVLDKAALKDTKSRLALVEKIIRECQPEVMYSPAPDDDHPSRAEAFNIAKAMLEHVRVVLGYQTATSGFGFHPARFTNISNELRMKMQALAAYESAGRADLSPALAQAYARYWSRFAKFTEVEAFELLKGG